MLLSSDLHLRENSSEVILGEVLPGIYNACVEHNETEVAILGDALHIRYRVDVRIQNALRDELKRGVRAGINWRILPGNHDQYDLNGRNALEVFGDLKGVKVYTEPTSDKDGLWIPYRKEAHVLENIIKSFPKHKFAYMHCGVKGAWMNDNVQDVEGVDAAILSGFKRVFSGHYHTAHLVGNCQYLGSPWQTSASEAGKAKGYWLFNPLGKKEPRFVETNWGPKYHCLEIASGEEIDTSLIDARDEVRIKVKGVGAEKEAAKLGKKLVKAGIHKNTVTPEVEAIQTRLNVEETAGLREYALAYVDSHKDDLDETALMQLFDHFATDSLV